MSTELLSSTQVSKLLGCKEPAVRRYARQRMIDVIIVGKRKFFTQEAVDKFIKVHTLEAKDDKYVSIEGIVNEKNS